jgi:hypothetical protein
MGLGETNAVAAELLAGGAKLTLGFLLNLLFLAFLFLTDEK